MGDLDKLSRDDWPGFVAFWGQFGAALKEGLYDAHEHREDLFKVCRFYSTHDNGDKLVSMSDYVERMKDDQKDIYYISGEDIQSLKNSPQIEGFKARGIEVLFFTDTIDDFWLQQVSDFQGHNFKSVTKGDIDLDNLSGDKSASTDNDADDASSSSSNDENENKSNSTPTNLNYVRLIDKLKDILKDEVEDVRISKRLTDSPVCLVASENSADMHMEQVLKIHQNYAGQSKPVLEINDKHPLIEKLADHTELESAAHLLLDQAKIIQGQNLKDPAGFAKRMSDFMLKGLG